ncbi:MAG: DNA-directed RNA polymerase subunit alpha [Firmicutes bacterium]|uniref:DNA-directed RNA polymerase subunit alpha n=1 Tax=Candidatus Scatoplasma merdavium TaxID=2840932 RepID=A0A9D9D848_9BACL|nr:DNA-directed RNA polymerase subunit alpha [Candidatus Scatoplasma merdavium]
MKTFTQLKFQKTADRENPNVGHFVLEPLEGGFGITLGNALRRVLLSSIPGASIYAVTIEGARHEFTALEGVIEDVPAIILNFKDLVLTIDGDDEDETPHVLTLDVSAEGEATTVKASDIYCPAGVHIINPDLEICHLAEGGHISMEISANRGRGYLTNEQNKKLYTIPTGTIATDSIYSPIVKVNYHANPTRVEHDTNYDSLELDVETNGAITPEDAVSLAAKILIEHLKYFEDLNPEVESTAVFNSGHEISRDKAADTPIEELELSVRSYNCLKRASISTINELCNRTEEELVKVRNLGKKSLKEVKEKLEAHGYHFRDAK